ncbi:Spy/CpxP family protein refolding chaperone [Aquitalea sp.]|uniref:Spy/CpxP family protein refolding chaperone n=1 Tax=Aquitalea sp. TaxID=1872623 RepID=UPI00258CF2C9|nr:Spy/CpxP family protein refolding chaperone [Aquitalea sp.]
MKLIKSLLIVGLLGGAAATTVHAMGKGDDCPMGDKGMSAHMWQMDPAKRQAMMEQHLQMLHDRLKIQPAQETAWKAYVDAMKSAQAPAMPMAKPDATLPEQMDGRVKMMQQHLDMMQKHVAATKALYQKLSPEQQKQFDQEARHMRDGMQHRMPRHRPASAPLPKN